PSFAALTDTHWSLCFSSPLILHPPAILPPYTTLFRSPAPTASPQIAVRTSAQGDAPVAIYSPTERTSRKNLREAYGSRCGPRSRSEEHTSELQSHLNIVCRLLVENKKHTIAVRRCGHY